MAEDEKPMMAERMKIDVRRYQEEVACEMLHKYEKIWSGQLGDIRHRVSNRPKTRRQTFSVPDLPHRSQEPRNIAIGDQQTIGSRRHWAHHIGMINTGAARPIESTYSLLYRFHRAQIHDSQRYVSFSAYGRVNLLIR